MIEKGLISAESDIIKNLELAIENRRVKLQNSTQLKKDIEAATSLEVHEEAERRKAEGDNSLGNETKRKPYYQELLQKHDTYPTLDGLIDTLAHEIKVLEAEHGFQKRTFYREMSKVVAVVREVSE